MLDVIICANFGVEKLRGLGNTRGQILEFPIEMAGHLCNRAGATAQPVMLLLLLCGHSNRPHYGFCHVPVPYGTQRLKKSKLFFFIVLHKTVTHCTYLVIHFGANLAQQKVIMFIHTLSLL